MTVKQLTNNLDYNKCADLIGNRFDMVLVASQRARELRRGSAKLVTTPNGPVVSALQEIEAGKVGREYLRKLADVKRK